MKKRFSFSLVAIAVSLASCTGSGKESDSGEVSAKVTTQKVSFSSIPEDYVFTGNVEGDRRVTLSTKIMGQILSMSVKEGSQVNAGQTVARIKSDDISAKRSQVKANLIEAQAALKNVEINYNRIKTLYESKSATRKEMDDIEMAYRMAQARVSAVEEMENEVSDVMGYGEVISPINGYVTKKMAQEGDMAIPGMPLLMVEDISILKIATTVPETEIHLFRIGDKVKIRIDALASKELTGTVDRINPGGNQASRQFEVNVTMTDIPNVDRSLIKSGMYAQVMLEKGTRRSLLIPENILIKRGQLEGLYVVSNNNISMLRWIKTGQKYGDRIEVLSGLDEGETVVVSDNLKLKDGHKIEVAQ